MLYAIGNSSDPALAEVALARLDDPSPLVRGAAVWALGQLLDQAAFGAVAETRAGKEADPDVQEEWAEGAPSPPLPLVPAE